MLDKERVTNYEKILNAVRIAKDSSLTGFSSINFKTQLQSFVKKEDIESYFSMILHDDNVESVYPSFIDNGKKIYVNGKIMFAPKAGISINSITSFLSKNGGRVDEVIDMGGFEKQYLASIVGNSIFNVSRKLYEAGLVSFAEPNFDFSAKSNFVPSDPLFSGQWFLNQPNDADIDAPEAWEITKGSVSAIVAVLDGGFNLGNPEMAGQYVNAYDAVNDNNNPIPESINDNHGTPCSALISCLTNNNSGVASVGYNIKVMPVKIEYDISPTGSFQTSSSIIANAAKKMISTPGIVAVSNSFSLNIQSTSIETSYNSMRQNCRNGLGAVILASTGNDNQSNSNDIPANLPDVVGVGATDRNDKRAKFSNYGEIVDVSAPGVDIYTLDRRGDVGYNSSDYLYFNGTSAACPIASAIVALMASVSPRLNELQLRNRLIASCDKVGGYSYNGGKSLEIGYGRVNAYNAVMGALLPVAPTGLTAVTASTSAINLSWEDNSTNEIGYLLERAEGAGSPFVQIAVLPPNTTKYLNSGLASKKQYFYQVRMKNNFGSGYSGYSNVASAKTL